MLSQLLLQFLIHVALGVVGILAFSILFVTLLNLFYWFFPHLSNKGLSGQSDADAIPTNPPQERHHV